MTEEDGRDRDEAGRARQARPRDALGRPLPYGEVGVEPVSEEPLPPEETLAAARALVEEGRPFSAHEVLEARWKAGPEQERDLWQGLAQLCVGLTHALRGNPVGARRLLDRGIARLEQYGTTAGPPTGSTCARSSRVHGHDRPGGVSLPAARASRSAAAQTSSGVLHRPSVSRTAAMARSGPRPMATRTGDGASAPA